MQKKKKRKSLKKPYSYLNVDVKANKSIKNQKEVHFKMKKRKKLKRMINKRVTTLMMKMHLMADIKLINFQKKCLNFMSRRMIIMMRTGS